MTKQDWCVTILFGVCILEYILGCFCWMKWKKWEDAYWANRLPRDTEMKKKTIVAEQFWAPKSERHG